MNSVKMFRSDINIFLVVVAASLLAFPLISYSQEVKPTSDAAAKQKYEYHIVLKGETLYSISRLYQTTVDVLLQLNPDIADNKLSTGASLKVPVNTPLHNSVTEDPSGVAILHLVKKKETLFAISRKYDVDIAQLQEWNNLTGTDIEQGSELIVGYEVVSLAPIGPLAIDKQQEFARDTFSVLSAKDAPVAAAVIVTDSFPDGLAQRGIATWVKSGDNGEDFYALHPTALKGTEVLIKNVMNGKTVTVKVIGKLPATSANEQIMIKISASAARKLGVLDEKFLAAMYYPGMNDLHADDTPEMK